jgi:hypothetical protein
MFLSLTAHLTLACPYLSAHVTCSSSLPALVFTCLHVSLSTCILHAWWSTHSHNTLKSLFSDVMSNQVDETVTIPCLASNEKGHCVRRTQSEVPVLSQLNPVHILQTYFKEHFNGISQLIPSSLFLMTSQTTILYAHHPSYAHPMPYQSHNLKSFHLNRCHKL